MKIKRLTHCDIDNWYEAIYQFKTKYNTIATAIGHGSDYAKAIAQCLKDYQIIISL